MATLPLLGQNRAYYIPNLMGGNAGPAAGTPALGESGVLRDLIASLLANFNPAMGGQVIRGMDNIPADSGGGSAMVPDAVGAGGGIPVNPIEALGQLGTLASGAQTVGMLGTLTGSPTVTGISNIIGNLAGAGSTYYSDAARDLTAQQLNRDLEMAGLEGNVDLGRYGYDPSLAAGAQIAPMITGLAGANPIVGGLIREGMMMAADPVPSTRGDLVRAGVDAVVPAPINAIISALTGSTIGANMKGAMTPVDESIARTPEEIAREEALGGRTAEGAPVETIVPTPVENIPPQDEATVNALIDAMAAASEPAPTGLGAIGAETIGRDLNFADSQSVRGPDIAMEPEAMAASVTPPGDRGILATISDEVWSLINMMGPVYTPGAQSAPLPAPPVAEPPPAPTGFSTSPEVVNAIFDEMAQYQQMIESESSMGSGTESPSASTTDSWGGFDYSGYSFG
jgi:hypothetical protein